MLELLKTWYPEDDPITMDQAETLVRMLGELLTEKAFEGFVIICSRLVDEFGNHRTSELSNVFRTAKPEGKRALVRSLEHVNQWVGGMEAYLRLYPVTIIPPNPAYPQLKILGIETIEPFLYRVMDSNAFVKDCRELTRDYIQRTSRLPEVPLQTVPVLRFKPIYHWCTYNKWDTPEATRDALQILPEWQNDCRLRATILTSNVAESAFMAFNGDRYDPSDSELHFYKYFFEPLAQDHPLLEGGGIQIGLEGAPLVNSLEQWDEASGEWTTIWQTTI